MTERQWLTSTDSLEMFEFFRETRLERGTRLDPRLRRFAVECCRRVRHLIVEETFRAAADAGEAFADDPHNKKSTIKLMAAAALYGWRRLRNYALTADSHRLCAARAALATCGSTDYSTAFNAMREAAQAVNRANEDHYDPAELEYQAELLRCLFGNPFRPIALDPPRLSWHGGLLVSMALRMYDGRDFTDMPVLANAFEEAGCRDPDILGHCRSGGEHVRGCWVVDLILGKG